jgi:hypothetical protein
MEIIACPLYGSRNTHSIVLGKAKIPYFARGYTCNDCDFKGIPLICSSEIIYKKILTFTKTNIIILYSHSFIFWYPSNALQIIDNFGLPFFFPILIRFETTVK